jgi:hypothetical protein
LGAAPQWINQLQLLRRLYSLFYRILPVSRVDVDDEIYLLNEKESAAIRIRERIAVSVSAIIGAMGVILLYVPYYVHASWFPVTPFHLFGKTFNLPLVFIAYSAVLVWIEIMLLTLLNIWCTHEIAVSTGFLDHRNKSQGTKINLLLDISLEKKNKKVLTYGIDPLEGLNKEALMVWNLLFILKATLTNFLFKFVIQRMLGRYALKAIQDFAGIPIFAFWNAFGTSVILREARVIIIGQNLIELVIRRMEDGLTVGDDDKELLQDTMQYIAISKRDFHQNHYLLTQNLFELYGIAHRDKIWEESVYQSRLKTASEQMQSLCTLLIVLGLLLDGKISAREKSKIRELHGEGMIPYSESEIIRFQEDFLNGKGVEALLLRHIPPQV